MNGSADELRSPIGIDGAPMSSIASVDANQLLSCRLLTLAAFPSGRSGHGGPEETDGAVPPKPVFDESNWRKTSYSLGNGQCIEAVSADGRVGVRDSKARQSPVIVFSAGEWQAFISTVYSR
jgi:hypothetical protein